MTTLDTSVMAEDAAPLPVAAARRLAVGWWGMWGAIASEAALFAYLLFSFFYIASQTTDPWPEGGLPKLMMPTINTGLLFASSIAAWWAERGVRRNRIGALRRGLACALLLGCTFTGVQLMEWHDKPFTLSSSVYGSLYFTITGFHMAHVIVGLGGLVMLLAGALRGYFDCERHSVVSIGIVYWHFVDAVWIAVYASIYLSPYLMP
jgi:heme/copper-type cytochrome/quinol oxidase subunit 3